MSGMETKIGGHPGLVVYRTDRGIEKRLTDAGLDGLSVAQVDLWRQTNFRGLHNEATLLGGLDGCGFTPRLVEEGADYLVLEDLGASEDITDVAEFRFNAAHLLLTLRRAEVRHGDLTDVNIIIKANKPMVIDFAQSSRYSEEKVDKRPASDSWWLWTFVAGRAEHQAARDPSRAVRRWLAIQEALGCKVWCPPAGCCAGKTLLDLGCFQGELTAMAAADGFRAHGIDYGGFRSGEDSIEIARERWGQWCTFDKRDVMEVEDFGYNAVLLLSTWAYIVQRDGREAAVGLLRRIVAQCGLLFFETQVYGDGPGPDFLRTEDDVLSLLSALGAVRPIVAIKVQGRDAIRTTWEVRGRGQV